jgi:ABC-2 type transport system ATP-binding protein
MSASEINKSLVAKGIYVSHLVKRKESLEELFLEITKNN